MNSLCWWSLNMNRLIWNLVKAYLVTAVLHAMPCLENKCDVGLLGQCCLTRRPGQILKMAPELAQCWSLCKNEVKERKWAHHLTIRTQKSSFSDALNLFKVLIVRSSAHNWPLISSVQLIIIIIILVVALFIAAISWIGLSSSATRCVWKVEQHCTRETGRIYYRLQSWMIGVMTPEFWKGWWGLL